MLYFDYVEYMIRNLIMWDFQHRFFIILFSKSYELADQDIYNFKLNPLVDKNKIFKTINSN